MQSKEGKGNKYISKHEDRIAVTDLSNTEK